MDKSAAATERDPVCGKMIKREESTVFFSYKGREYHFCSSGCRSVFEKKPDKYLKPKGFVARFFERLARSNQEQFEARGAACSH
jgi:YHS domain-containing protein